MTRIRPTDRLAQLLIPAGLTLLSLGLSLWGISGSLPYPGNGDEVFNYVLPAVRIPASGLEPLTMLNPPGYIYAIYLVYGLLHGFGSPVLASFLKDPGQLILEARVISAVAGSLAVTVTYFAARKAFNSRAAIFAGLLAATAFLPIVYAHLSLNDAPTLLPVAASLLGAVGVLRNGGYRWYLLAGASAGLASGVKYTGGFIIAAMLIAAVLRIREDGLSAVLLRAISAGCAAALAFLAANPYALLDFDRFRQGIEIQNSAMNSHYKYGETNKHASGYYLWTLTWGLGWVPAIASAAGAVLLTIRDRRLALVLLLPALALFLSLVTKPLYFSRYLLPAYPILILLAAYAANEAVTKLARGRFAWKVVLGTAAALLLCGQSLAHVIHFDRVWSRTNTQELAARWARANIPAGLPALTDQYLPAWWPATAGNSPNPAEPSDRYPAGLLAGQADPLLLDKARRAGHCWVIASSYEAGRIAADPAHAPRVAAYYAELHRDATLAFRATPFEDSRSTNQDIGSNRFSFDFSYNNYPFEYERPGPILSIYRLNNCTTRD